MPFLKRLKWLPIVIIVAMMIIFWIASAYIDFNWIKYHQLQLKQFVSDQPFYAICIYLFLYILIVALSIPAASYMSIVGGFMFGQILGSLLVIISATMGACILFVSVKLISKDWIERQTSGFINQMRTGFNNNALTYLIFLRLVPLFPFAVVNLVPAILQIPFITFFIGTIVGIIPGSIIYVSFGAALDQLITHPNHLVSQPLIFAVLGFIIIALSYIYVKNKK